MEVWKFSETSTYKSHNEFSMLNTKTELSLLLIKM